MIVASATRCTARPYEASRIETFRSCIVAHVSSKARVTISFRRAFTSSSFQKYSCSPWTHSKYETTTPPAFASTSGQHERAARLEDLVGSRRDGAVRAFDDQLRLDLVSVVGRDHLLERARREHLTVDEQKLLVRDRIAARPLDQRSAVALVRERRRDVQPARVVDAAARVRDRDDLRAFFGGELREERADIAEALHGDPRVRERLALAAKRRDETEERAARGRLLTTQRAADRQRLAGDDAEHGVPLVHRVGVEDPRHRRRVRADVRRRNVLLRPDLVDDLGGEAARHALELRARHRLRVADHSALRAAERQPHQRALPGHPHRERLHLVERHIGVVADAALRRPARDVVRDAEAGERAHVTVVERRRDRDLDRLLALLQDVDEALIDAEDSATLYSCCRASENGFSSRCVSAAVAIEREST